LRAKGGKERGETEWEKWKGEQWDGNKTGRNGRTGEEKERKGRGGKKEEENGGACKNKHIMFCSKF